MQRAKPASSGVSVEYRSDGCNRVNRSQLSIHSTKKMHVQVTPPDRPLPPGEGRGEGLCHSGSEVNRQSIKNSPSEGVKKSNERILPATPHPIPLPPEQRSREGGSNYRSSEHR